MYTEVSLSMGSLVVRRILFLLQKFLPIGGNTELLVSTVLTLETQKRIALSSL